MEHWSIHTQVGGWVCAWFESNPEGLCAKGLLKNGWPLFAVHTLCSMTGVLDQELNEYAMGIMWTNHMRNYGIKGS